MNIAMGNLPFEDVFPIGKRWISSQLCDRLLEGALGRIRKTSPNTSNLTLPETNIAHENPIFPGKYHQNGRCSMAMLVYRSVNKSQVRLPN